MTQSKRASESRTLLTDLVLPSDTNHHHTIFGGKVMAYIDKIACIAAMRHCRKPVVTASSDSVDFLAPIKAGEAIYLEAYVTWAHRTSMEVFVKVEAENLLTGERRVTAHAYLTFVALDESGKPTSVPAVIPETEEEKQQYRDAEERYMLRKKRKQRWKM
ncbi:thioesterase superfamily protein [Anoxybacillus sp. B7M1]|jgi:acyl-CoA hydrolase|uniref:Acyl-CoA thioesterase n=1 Tax=Anoxybacteroides rupiense TaxID=311460 RepID=A0ABD5IZC1_9BACL|nr:MULTISPECIES: acyl-CoA thioesterase [Anoxybacillus]ANB56369.1 thioesterase superfamily protein [Anoxybacillus sp. B2M1]ANB63362.1 thioesterase superfamily protein [Anoxybacillus sp. B7M1]KXG10939.1 putative acyl-CoA thioester hydrolase [Anoxybacillus sp. P3H1B]MBB3907895.1 acyl-CoA hydrolase [Anoxybacillus rupiensis]MBS2772529.1 acyl-CoA thioesterase [Anoxybacillus rupiensis]